MKRAALITSIFVIAITIFCPACNNSLSYPWIGEKGYIYTDEPGYNTVAMTIDEDSFDELLAARYANDEIGVEMIYDEGRAFSVKIGTEVLVIDHHDYLLKVRILEGEYEKQALWVPKELVSKEFDN
ncbi:MAG: hypothetical protein JW790_02835 [Dehalococcoidales bacterium]|nr:hypothetical protein [Dehalococcoidales bacterium]